MFRYLWKQVKAKKSAKDSAKDSELPQQEFQIKLFEDASENLDNIKQMFHQADDIITREIMIGESEHRCGLVCIDGLVDKTILDEKVIANIQQTQLWDGKKLPNSGREILTELKNKVLAVSEIKVVHTLDEVSLEILSGQCALFVDGSSEALIIGMQGWKSRAIEEPSTEAIIRGPRDGFTEDIRSNTVALRRHLRDPNLRLDTYYVGRRSKKLLILSYIEGIVHPEIVREVKRRISSIDIDDAPESGYIEQWIQDSFLSPFPQVIPTERPDKVSSALLQGKVGIFLDNTPFALIVPAFLANQLQSPEDYYERWFVGTLLRLLRYTAAFLATFLPAIYIALVSFHQGMIPSKLAFSIASAREGVPFPAIVEALMMEATLELLREAGIRLPKPIGQTIGIVGGLVIGEAAVSAGIVSPIMVIVVAITAISSFALPAYSFALSLRIIRFAVMISAGIFGLYGVILSSIMINVHLVNLKSFGIPYSTPFAPFMLKDLKDVVMRVPILMLGTRPKMMNTLDQVMIDKGGDNREDL